MIMSSISTIPAGSQAESVGHPVRSIGAVLRRVWLAYLERRLHQQAAAQLHAMSDRQLKDIGVSRSQIDAALRGPDPLTPKYLRGRYY
jgi:uncharacterized protein YjiS (DUF1127 family)